jgi:predicted Zn-dependent peptidase
MTTNKKVSIHKKSGLRYMIERNLSPKYDYTTIIFYVNVGVIHELPQQLGLSHFCEHLKFSGTCDEDKNLNKDDPTLSANELIKRLERYDCIKNDIDIFKNADMLNARLNAYTDKDHTAYYIKLQSKYVNYSFNLLFDMLFNTHINQKRIDKEKNIVIEEEKRLEDDTVSLLYIKMNEIVFRDHPLGWNMVNKHDMIKNYNTNLLKHFLEKNYFVNNMHISISSSLPNNVIKNKLNYYIDKYNVEKTKKESIYEINKKKIIEDKKKLISKPVKQEIYVLPEDKKSCNIIMGFLIPFGNEKNNLIEKYSFYLLSMILGEINSSRLFIELREKNSWVYGVSSDIEIYQNLGIFTIESSCDEKNIYKVIKCILKKINEIKEKPVTNLELTTVKNKLIYQKLKLKNETDFDKATHNGIMMLYNENEIITDNQIKNTINNISEKDIINVANKVLDINNVKLCLSGNVDKKKIAKIVNL